MFEEFYLFRNILVRPWAIEAHSVKVFADREILLDQLDANNGDLSCLRTSGHLGNLTARLAGPFRERDSLAPSARRVASPVPHEWGGAVA